MSNYSTLTNRDADTFYELLPKREISASLVCRFQEVLSTVKEIFHIQ